MKSEGRGSLKKEIGDRDPEKEKAAQVCKSNASKLHDVTRKLIV